MSKLQLVVDTAVSQQSFADWESCLLAGAIQNGSMWWMHEGGVFFRRHQDGENGGLELGLDPLGKVWAVQINEPPVPGDYNRMSNIAVDPSGARFLLRQGWLRPNSQHPIDIKDEDFIDLTGLQPVPVEGEGLAAKRRWFVVAALNEEPEVICRRTASFVERCWAARATPLQGAKAQFQPPFEPYLGGSEKGGTYTIYPKSMLDPKIVLRRHGIIWRCLTALLSANKVSYCKWQHPSGYQIDLVIDRKTEQPSLVELKTEISAADLYTGIGQLYLYRRLFPALKNHSPVLLIPKGLQEGVKSAIKECGVAIHEYELIENDNDGHAIFSPEFLAFCGIQASA